MKKKLLSEIQQLAQQLQQESVNQNVTKLKETTARLHEKLVVLEYLEKQITEEQAEDLQQSFDSKSYREEHWFKDPEPVPQPEHEHDLVEPLMEKIKDLVAQMPEESQRVDDLLDEILPKNPSKETPTAKQQQPAKHTKNDIEEFATTYQTMPTFERKQNTPSKQESSQKEEKKESTQPTKVAERAHEHQPKKKSLNDSAKRGLQIGLNDRLAYIKHLFDGNADDYTRVLSQINTKDSYSEAETFIKAQVKPDYNHWLEKDEYVDRFMGAIEKSFQ
ncbi:hypothetical protein MG296_04445 [Flavobacteriaceae bacterium TK19130]|nr:hypothetical protein [Thermobacterium salinum]